MLAFLISQLHWPQLAPQGSLAFVNQVIPVVKHLYQALDTAPAFGGLWVHQTLKSLTEGFNVEDEIMNLKKGEASIDWSR